MRRKVVDKVLPARTLALAGVTVSSSDRWEFSGRTTRLLDLVNRERHSEYVVPLPMRCKSVPKDMVDKIPTAMPASDKEYYTHVRL